MLYSVKGFYEISEDMVQILLMLEVLFTQDSEAEDLVCCTPFGTEPSIFFSNYLFRLKFKPVLDDRQHDFARVMLLLSQFPHEGSVVDLLLGAECSPELHCHHNFHGCTILSNILSIC